MVLSLGGLGCATAISTSRDATVADPSMSDSTAVERANIALARLQPYYPDPICVHVVHCQKPSAYSSNDGTICLSSGLITLLGDDEIAAVIAHELGHLTQSDESPSHMRFSLAGPITDVEQRADAEAVMLMRRGGIPMAALARVLEKVRDARQTPAQLRDALTTRIALLPH
jgi:hypothetical protein